MRLKTVFCIENQGRFPSFGVIIIFCNSLHYSPDNTYLCLPKNPGLKLGVMLAIVKIAGQQFKVKAGDSLYVPHIEGKTGDSVEFSDVLITHSGDNVLSGSNVKAVVKAEIINDLIKGDKVIAFKMKRRKGFRKKHGHRTQYTQIKVTAIA